jgi:hypothetical protein
VLFELLICNSQRLARKHNIHWTIAGILTTVRSGKTSDKSSSSDIYQKQNQQNDTIVMSPELAAQN